MEFLLFLVDVYSEQYCKLLFGDLGADNTKTADNACATETNVALAGDIVEVDPSAVVGCDNSLCAQNHSVLFSVGEALKSRAERVGIELLGGFRAVAYEYLVGVVMVVSVLVVVTAGAVAVFILVMMVFVLVLIVVMTARTIAVFIVMMMVLVLVLIVVMSARTITVFIVMMVVMMMVMMLVLRFFCKLFKLGFKRGFALHSFK